MQSVGCVHIGQETRLPYHQPPRYVREVKKSRTKCKQRQNGTRQLTSSPLRHRSASSREFRCRSANCHRPACADGGTRGHWTNCCRWTYPSPDTGDCCGMTFPFRSRNLSTRSASRRCSPAGGRACKVYEIRRCQCGLSRTVPPR